MKYKPGDKVFVKIRDEWKPAVYAKHRDSVDLPHGVRFEDGSYYIIYDSEIIDRHKCEKCGLPVTDVHGNIVQINPQNTRNRIYLLLSESKCPGKNVDMLLIKESIPEIIELYLGEQRKL
jgi:hypothetical protein